MSVAPSHLDKASRRPVARMAHASVHAVTGLGTKLKAARERLNISVRGLARSINLSPSLISQIENGVVTPSVGTLYAIVTELGIGLDELFPGKPKLAADAPATRPDLVRRSDGREVIRLADGVRWELLTPAPDPDLEFLYVVYEPGAESCPSDMLVRHGGMEYAYLLSGRLGVRIGFNEYEINPGDSISFDAQSPHRLWTIGKKPAMAVWAILNRSGDKRTRRRHQVRDAQSGSKNRGQRRTARSG